MATETKNGQDNFMEQSPAAFRRLAVTLGFRARKRGNRWDLFSTKTGYWALTNATQAEAVNWLAEKVFGFSPD